jgi:hypothetical protein
MRSDLQAGHGESSRRTRERPAIFPVHPAIVALLVCTAFAIYWYTSFALVARDGTTYFGADSWHYTDLAQGVFNERIFRLHPVTISLALGWMKLAGLLPAWFTPEQMLRAFFALAGALGVWAALCAFAAVMPRRLALLWTVIYAGALTIWYFSAIEESKIVSASLAALYIAVYLQLRERWTLRGAALLTTILFAACMNEIVAGFLVAIPAADALLRHGFKFRELRWVPLHALAGPAALFILDGLIRDPAKIAPETADGTSHLGMLLWYAARNTYSLTTVYEYLLRWLFFNIAAPEPELHYANAALRYGGDFEAVFQHYFTDPLRIAIVLGFGLVLAASLWPRGRKFVIDAPGALLLAIGAYALLRGVFFYFFIPGEALIYSPSATLAHLLLLAIPFAASNLPGKTAVLALFGALLWINNGLFMFTAQVVP